MKAFVVLRPKKPFVEMVGTVVTPDNSDDNRFKTDPIYRSYFVLRADQVISMFYLLRKSLATLDPELYDKFNAASNEIADRIHRDDKVIGDMKEFGREGKQGRNQS